MTLDAGERERREQKTAHLARFVADCRRELENGPDPHLSLMLERGEARLEKLRQATASA